MSSSLCGSPAPPGLLSPLGPGGSGTPSAHSSYTMSVSMGGASANVSRLSSVPVTRLVLLEDDLDRSGRDAEAVMAHANALKVEVTFYR